MQSCRVFQQTGPATLYIMCYSYLLIFVCTVVLDSRYQHSIQKTRVLYAVIPGRHSSPILVALQSMFFCQLSAVALSDFNQTHTNDALWDRGECIKFWGQRSRLGPLRWNNIILCWNSTSRAEALYSRPTRRSLSIWSFYTVSQN